MCVVGENQDNNILYSGEGGRDDESVPSGGAL